MQLRQSSNIKQHCEECTRNYVHSRESAEQYEQVIDRLEEKLKAIQDEFDSLSEKEEVNYSLLKKSQKKLRLRLKCKVMQYKPTSWTLPYKKHTIWRMPCLVKLNRSFWVKDPF